MVQELGGQPGLAQAARLLYQLEVLLLQPHSQQVPAVFIQELKTLLNTNLHFCSLSLCLTCFTFMPGPTFSDDLYLACSTFVPSPYQGPHGFASMHLHDMARFP